MASYAIGLDYGTNSVRAIVVDCEIGAILGSGVFDYSHGDKGVVTDPADANVARQHPQDYLEGLKHTVKTALAEAGIDPSAIKGIGVDATSSTPIPVDETGMALALKPEFADNPNAYAWLWKDHTSHAEALEITEAAGSSHPEYLAACGGAYSSEWYWSKLLHCSRVAPDVFETAASWTELPDWIPAVLTGTQAPDQVKRCSCAAGHKGLFSPEWDGYPAEDFIASFDNGVLSKVRKTLKDEAFNIGDSVGVLCAEWAAELGLPEGIPVAAGIIDAHAGAVGSGISPGTMVKIIGTSTCDIAVASLDNELPDIPGICGIAHESVLPGCYGLEAGQSAVGDIFNWYVHKLQPGGGLNHDALGLEAEVFKPGESGLLALDWNNGNRSLLTDPNLTGMMLGLTLHTTPAEIFRALVEATAFGARMIIERYKEYGVPIERVINCGGISIKSPMTMQIYADVLGCTMEVSDNPQSCALGAAMAGAVVGGVFSDFGTATEAMTRVSDIVYEPIPGNQAVYDRLFALYKQLHDLFGTKEYAENQFDLMKELIAIREEVCRKPA
ncbi:MAG: ribulokinase [Kiritimatiellales bacterium]|nr:ribulokinase [Kiritimatiellales bacterium]